MRTENRMNWVISQAVDDVIISLRVGKCTHEDARRRLSAKLVPIAVQERVLAGHAVLRHRRFPADHAPYKGLAPA